MQLLAVQQTPPYFIPSKIITFPGLTTKLITHNLPPQKYTICAHIKQESQNLQSTKVVQVTLEDAHADAFPTPDTPNVK